MGHFVHAVRFDRTQSGVKISILGRSKRGTTFIIGSEEIKRGVMSKNELRLKETEALAKLMTLDSVVSPT